MVNRRGKHGFFNFSSQHPAAQNKIHNLSASILNFQTHDAGQTGVVEFVGDAQSPQLVIFLCGLGHEFCFGHPFGGQVHLIGFVQQLRRPL